MTDEEITTLYMEIDQLLAIYTKYNPITKEGFDLERVKSCTKEMIDFSLKDENDRKNMLDWMEKNDFWKTPASTKFHGNFESGLCVHSLQVVFQALKFAKPVLNDFFQTPFRDNFTFTASDIFIACISHDFCKSGSYEIQFRNTKDVFGNWVKKPYYKTRDDIRNLGHGNESVLKLLEVLPSMIRNRTVIEAVSRHMGFSDLSESESYNYSNFLNNPLVVLIQLADETASAWYNN